MPAIKIGHTFSEAKALMNGKEFKSLGNNTGLQRRGGDALRLGHWEKDLGKIQVLLHGSPIVTLCPDGSIELDTLGFSTKTTKSRMNDYLSATHPGIQVSQKGFQWFIVDINDGGKQYKMNQTATVDAMGKIHTDADGE